MAPSPTASGVGSGPERSPRSWPPPENSGASRSRGRRRTRSAPMPLGPYILWPLIDTRSRPWPPASSGIEPAACAASVCRVAPAAWTRPAIAGRSCSTPVSLCAAITLTSSVGACASAASSVSSASSPSAPTGRTTTSKPSARSARALSSTQGCSVATVTIRRRDASPSERSAWRARPLIARLLASVAPEVKTISRGSAPSRAATCPRASSTASAARRPPACAELCGLA